MDRGIQLATDGGVDLTRLYGFPIHWQITADPLPSMDEFGGGAFRGMPVTTLPDRSAAFDVTVLKPHGSLNWLGPLKGHYDEGRNDDLRQGRSVILPLDADGALRYLPTTNLPPWVQLPNELPINVEPVILTPRGAKKADRPFLRETRDKEEAAILDADEVYVLGWSVPRTDIDQACMIRTLMGKRSKQIREVTIVNFSADADYYARVQELFGVERRVVRTYNTGFRDFVESI